MTRLGRYLTDHDEYRAVADLSEKQKAIIQRARPFTMTGIERMASLMESVTYICRRNIPGDIAECGVWKGGSMMVVAMTLLQLGDTSRNLYLFDTFEGMTAPSKEDRQMDGRPAAAQLENTCLAEIDSVRENILGTGYPKERVHFIKGRVEETIPTLAPTHLSLLRLDTDWYESTKHELTHLYPRLHPKGILIIDDYGHWQGARQAVDEYFSNADVYLHRMDYTGRILVRTD
jgi:O-methyltransferase